VSSFRLLDGDGCIIFLCGSAAMNDIALPNWYHREVQYYHTEGYGLEFVIRTSAGSVVAIDGPEPEPSSNRHLSLLPL
jgi:hypothetical protein